MTNAYLQVGYTLHIYKRYERDRPCKVSTKRTTLDATCRASSGRRAQRNIQWEIQRLFTALADLFSGNLKLNVCSCRGLCGETAVFLRGQVCGVLAVPRACKFELNLWLNFFLQGWPCVFSGNRVGPPPKNSFAHPPLGTVTSKFFHNGYAYCSQHSSNIIQSRNTLLCVCEWVGWRMDEIWKRNFFKNFVQRG